MNHIVELKSTYHSIQENIFFCVSKSSCKILSISSNGNPFPFNIEIILDIKLLRSNRNICYYYNIFVSIKIEIGLHLFFNNCGVRTSRTPLLILQDTCHLAPAIAIGTR